MVDDDPSLEDALNLLEGMDMKDMSEVVQQLIEVLMESGEDDPETLEELESLLQLTEGLKDLDDLDELFDQAAIDEAIRDDEMVIAAEQAIHLHQLTTWEQVWANQDKLLQALIASGTLDAEDEALFQESEEDWRDNLEFIWGFMERKAAAAAAAAAASEGGKDEL